MIEEESSTKIVTWIFKNIKFIIIPGFKLKDLSSRESEYQKMTGKRKRNFRVKSKLTIIGIIIIFIVVSFAIFSSWLSPYTFEQAMSSSYSSSEWFAEPSAEHPLGQTYRGRDVLARIIFGAQSTLLISFCSVAISLIIGVFLGLIAGYYGGWVDTILMRIMDIILSFPGIVLAITIIALTRNPYIYISITQSIINLILVFTLIGIPHFARLIRATTLQVRHLPYINAARVVGSNKIRLMFRHILPNCIHPIIISFTHRIGGVIISLSILSFLGFSDARLIEWGNDISAASMNMISAPWALLYPCLMILITVLGFMLLGDGLRESIDPLLKNL